MDLIKAESKYQQSPNPETAIDLLMARIRLLPNSPKMAEWIVNLDPTNKNAWESLAQMDLASDAPPFTSPHIFAMPHSPLYNTIWQALEDYEIGRFGTTGTWLERYEPTVMLSERSGEVWQYQGTWYLRDHQGNWAWEHQFRHRDHPLMQDLRSSRQYANFPGF